MSNKTETPKTETAGTKTEAPKAELPRFPMPWELPWMTAGHEVFARGQEMFAQAMKDQISRTQKVMDELAGYESVAVDRARVVPIRVAIYDAGQRYHVPLYFSPWGFMTYRGS